MPNRRVLSLAARGLAVAWIATTGAATVLAQAPAPTPTPAAPAKPDVVRIVRFKLSAADLASAEAWTEDYKRDYGADAAWLDARAWLARGAWMLRQPDRALAFAQEVRDAIPEPRSELLIPLGAAIEVEGCIRAERDGAAAGVRFFKEAEKLSPDVAFRARMWKNVNRLEMVGAPAPELAVADFVGTQPPTLASLRGRPVLLFLWADGCGDCKASAPMLARIREAYAPRGLAIVAPTRLYGPGRDGTPATPDAEKSDIARTLATTYAGLPDLPVPLDTETMVRYGVSATPTFVLVDGAGTVRLYAPTRLTFEALATAVEPLLSSPAKPSS